MTRVYQTPSKRSSSRLQNKETEAAQAKRNRSNPPAKTQTPAKKVTKLFATVTPPPKRSKKGKKKDDMLVDTDTKDNTNEVSCSTFVTFLTLRFTVKESKKGSEAMREEISKLYKYLLEADNTVSFTHYKLETEEDPETGEIVTDTNKVLDNPEDLPTSITSLGKFFFGARPNSKGGSIWTQVRIMHDAEIDNIIADTREDFKDNNAQLMIQSIQHFDVASLGFFKHLHPEIDVANFSAFLSEELDKLHPTPKLKIGLKVKTPYDGKKRDPGKTSNYRDRIQAVHIDAEGNFKAQTAKLIKHILTSKTFEERYNCEVRIVPPFDRHGSPHIQDKIRKCIVQHGQFCKCVISTPCDGIEYLDTPNKALKKTLRQLVLGLKDSHFINIDLNWSRSSFSILYPKKYEEISKEKIANLGAYLHQQYKDPILHSLTAAAQEDISEVIWDKNTGRPLSKLDRELDDIIKQGDDLDYVDISLITVIPERPIAIPPSDTFIPNMDTESVSTFGTVKPPAKLSTASLSQPSPAPEDVGTVISAMTIDTRVSNMETRFDNIEKMLELLVGKAQIGDTVTPPNTSPSAGVGNTTPANGV